MSSRGFAEFGGSESSAPRDAPEARQAGLEGAFQTLLLSPFISVIGVSVSLESISPPRHSLAPGARTPPGSGTPSAGAPLWKVRVGARAPPPAPSA